MTSLRSVLARTIAVTVLAMLAIGTAPATASAQKALVYCPASIDVTGCDNTITALGTAFPGGVDRGYDGSSGTMDMRTIDLWSYAVIVVPSLADGSGGLPYAFLRDTAVSGKLHAAIMGRIALWSGTPDQGTANRAAKNSLLQSLAHWAQGNYATVKGPGLVALQDLSDSVSHRYDWLHAITGLTITADSAVYSYASVGAVTATGTAILTDAGGATIAYSNMASLGFFLPQGAAGLHLDAVGQTGTSQGGQVVLATSPGGNTGTAVIATDKDDYAPGSTVTITGRGFQPGETVTISFAEQPALDQPPPIAVVADASGSFTDHSFSPDAQDAGTRFIATAVGTSSGMQAQATFTDAAPSTVAFAAQSPAQVVGGADASFVVSVTFGGNSGPACTAQMSATPGTAPAWPVGATFTFVPTSVTGSKGTTTTTTLTVHTPAGMAAATYPFTVSATGACQGSGQQVASGGGSLVVVAPALTTANATVSSSAASSAFGQAVTFTATLNPSTATGSIQFQDGGNNLGSPQTIVGGSASLSVSSLSVGTHTIGAIYAPGSGFAAGTITSVSQSVTKAAATVTLGNLAQTYTGAALSASATTSPAGLIVDLTYNGASQAPTAAGSYAVIGTVNDASYQGSATGTLVIAKAAQAAVTLTGAPATAQPYQATFTVGATGGSGTGAYSFAATGVCTVNATTGLVTMTSGTGTCSLTASRAGDGNYNASAPSAASTVTAAKAAQVIAWTAPAPITYGTTLAGVLNATITTGDGTLSYDHASTETPTPGSLTITATASATANYNSATAQVTLTVNKATVTPSVTAQNKVYDGTTAAQASGTLAGTVGSDVVTLGIGSATFADRNVGTGKTVTVAGLTLGGAQAGFYTLSTTSATTTADITRAPLTVTAPSPSSIVYGSAAPAITPAFATFVGTDDASAVTGVACGTTYVAGSNVGTYATTCSGGSAQNYALSYQAGSFSVTKASLSVTANDKSRVYGSANPSLDGTLTGVYGSDGITATYATTAVQGSDVGTYPITPSLSDPNSKLGNYNVTSTNGTLTITKAPLSVTASDATREYGDPNPTFTGTLTGVVNSDGITATFGSTADPTTSVGSYPITPTLSDPGSRLGNYNVTSTNGTLKITQAPLSVTPANAQRLYGAANPVFTGTVTGIKNSDPITASYATTATPATGVGTYDITASLVDPSSKLGNYAVTVNKGTLTIDPAPLTVKADDATRLYGDPNPTFTGTLTGIQNSDPITASYATTAVVTSGVGSYPIAPTLADPGSKLGNYTVTSTNGTLSITQAPLTIAAANATRTYGAQDPTFTGTITGLKNNDAITATYATTATQQSHVGTYAITPTAVDANPPRLANYAVTLTNGTFTITQATPTINWGPITQIPQGTALSATQLNASASGVFNETVSGSFTYTPPAGTVEYDVGIASLSTSFTSSNTDYTGATKGNSVQVTNVAPTVTSITLGSAPIPVNQSVSIQSAFTDPGIHDTWTAVITWDDGTTSQGTVSNGVVTGSHTFTTAGVYTITVAVSDNNGGTGTRSSSQDLVGYIVVYDPSAGFVTGGGWINSPSGACRLTTVCNGATGKANFGFNARYQKGANVPDGTTEFQFQAGGLNFHSTVYQWLVVAGTKAQYKGSGTVNGVSGYNFLLTAIDGTQKGNPDAFRIKITDAGGNVVYDNQMGSADDSDNATNLGGGSIVIH